jgi:hypothetical protein
MGDRSYRLEQVFDGLLMPLTCALITNHRGKHVAGSQ